MKLNKKVEITVSHIWRSYLLSILGVFLASAPVAADLRVVIAEVTPGVVAVGTSRPVKKARANDPPAVFLGTGFAVSNGHYVVTNHHVIPEKLDIANEQTLAVFSGRGKSAKAHRAILVASDERHDLALLRIEQGPLPALTLGQSDSVVEGEDIVFTGFPIGMVLGLYHVTHRGMVSAISPIVIPAHSSSSLSAAQLAAMRNPFEIFQLDATAYPGNSGSPVYSAANGEVIGVLNGVLVKKSKEALLSHPSGISYAIPVTHVHQLLKNAGIQ